MTIEIKLPSVFARYTNGLKSVSSSAVSVRQALTQLVDEFPELKLKIFTPDNELRHFINVYVNANDVRTLDSQDPDLRDGDSITLIPAIAGG
ncbi:MAG: molybdopterin synthase sulfur carrier subunit [Gammaproteobacteria bacterium]|nr:MAG: molybdopterin synthase sulfur carrier subunit [Gammaproteobacteria bacterium]